MKNSIIAFMTILIVLALLSKRPAKIEPAEFRPDRDAHIRELELEKAEEIRLYHRRRYEQLRELHPPQNKDFMEAELKMKLSEIDAEIARLMCD